MIPEQTSTLLDRTSGGSMSSRRRGELALVLGSLIAFGPLTIDVYLPAFPPCSSPILTCRPSWSRMARSTGPTKVLTKAETTRGYTDYPRRN